LQINQTLPMGSLPINKLLLDNNEQQTLPMGSLPINKLPLDNKEQQLKKTIDGN